MSHVQCCVGIYVSTFRRGFSQGDGLIHGHLQVPQVPQDPEHQTAEDQEGPREDEHVPEAPWCEDADEEEDEANDVKQDGHDEERHAASDTLGVLHDCDAERERNRQRV